ncbi:MAG: DUF721 domain-containing protein [Alkalispirochaeta sp.]
MDNFEPNSARELINRFIHTIGARDETGVVPFVQAWPKIVGQDKAAHSQVLDVKNGTVLIGVDHPAWLHRMHMDRTRIVARIQQDFPSLNARNLAFTIVNQLNNPWRGDTEEDDTAHRESAPPGGSQRGAGTSAIEHPPTEEPPGETAPSAAEDDEFQQRLNRLKEALEEKEHQERGDDHQPD